ASWIIGYIFELASPNLGGKLFWDDFQFIGSLLVPLLLMFFAYEFTGQEKHLPRNARVLLLAPVAVFLVLLYTNPLHGWIRSDTARIVSDRPFDVLLYDFTIPMWVSFIYGYFTYLAATVLFIRNLRRQHRLFRTQTLIILLGFVFPFLGSIPGIAGVVILGQRDIVPYTFGIGNLIYAWGLFRYGLFEITPIAREAVIEYMNDAAIVVDDQSRVVDINPAALRGLELAVNQVIGFPISGLFADRPNLLKLFEYDGPIHQDAVYVSQKGTEFVLDVFVSPLYDPNNKLIGRILVARDITEQRQAEEQLRKAYDELELRVQHRTAELETANQELERKNAELERFTYTVSHDLKAPLVTISGYLGYLNEDIKTANIERLEKDTQRIADAVDKMKNLLNDLLELSRIGRISNPYETVAFEDLIREALDIVHGRLEERGITVHSQSNLPLVHVDKPRLIEVLQNLLDNAAKFMGDQQKPMVVIGVVEGYKNVPVFFVKDNGIGIAPEFHERIFGLFNRLDPNIEGTGVGLALVKRIIEFHGGRIWVESEAGKGTTFYFTVGDQQE
ncbi:MAG TPA: histidine kinase N-terminal 7TM domain-containing protein, partial [Anaerolineales bacterium]